MLESLLGFYDQLAAQSGEGEEVLREVRAVAPLVAGVRRVFLGDGDAGGCLGCLRTLVGTTCVGNDRHELLGGCGQPNEPATKLETCEHGCWLGECHYVTEGNYDALNMMHLCRKLLENSGVNPERLRIEWISAAEGTRFAEIMSDFTARLRDLGPIGEGEGLAGFLHKPFRPDDLVRKVKEVLEAR